jgi:hypothetical protein
MRACTQLIRNGCIFLTIYIIEEQARCLLYKLVSHMRYGGILTGSAYLWGMGL